MNEFTLAGKLLSVNGFLSQITAAVPQELPGEGGGVTDVTQIWKPPCAAIEPTFIHTCVPMA